MKYLPGESGKAHLGMPTEPEGPRFGDPVRQHLGRCSSAEFRLSQGARAQVCRIIVNRLFSSHVVHATHRHQHSHPAISAGRAGGEEGRPAAGVGWKRSGRWDRRAKPLGGFVTREMAFIQKWLLTPRICNQQGARRGLNSPFRHSSDLHVELSNSLHLFITSTSWYRTNSALEVLWTYSKARFSFLGHSNSSSPW